MNIHKLIEKIIEYEGGYIRQSPTKKEDSNKGITLTLLKSYDKRIIEPEELKNIDDQTANLIIFSEVYEKNHLGRIPEEILPTILDAAVMENARTAIKLLQYQLIEDQKYFHNPEGKMNEQTINGAQKSFQDLGIYMVDLLIERRIIRFYSRVNLFPSQKEFLDGWIQRAQYFRPETFII